MMQLNDNEYALICDALHIAKEEYKKREAQSANEGWHRLETHYRELADWAAKILNKIENRDD